MCITLFSHRAVRIRTQKAPRHDPFCFENIYTTILRDFQLTAAISQASQLEHSVNCFQFAACFYQNALWLHLRKTISRTANERTK